MLSDHATDSTVTRVGRFGMPKNEDRSPKLGPPIAAGSRMAAERMPFPLLVRSKIEHKALILAFIF